ncbi:hypothetical protein [Nitratireductor alexandrii]|uniref:hypothetical protein n=1 Tax=Nitratireductor alexandrii TaxID=2448161 RepID=UPI001EE973D6|nr:hypothetical protein [Nitratireductor alexandrii]
MFGVLRVLSVFLVLSLSAAGLALASDAVRHQEVRFAAGESSTTLSDRIVGYGSVDYLLDARAGQTMTVVFEPSNAGAYFNIYEPGKGPGEEAMFIGAINGNDYSGVLPADGTYTVQVYLVRAAARRGEEADYQLHIGIDAMGGQAGAVAPSTATSVAETDARVAGTPYSATGKIDCTFTGDETVTRCDFGVVRAGGAVATVDIVFPDGFKRTLDFDNGVVTSPQTGEVATHREQDTTFVTVDGAEHFAIPDAVIEGG